MYMHHGLDQKINLALLKSPKNFNSRTACMCPEPPNHLARPIYVGVQLNVRSHVTWVIEQAKTRLCLDVANSNQLDLAICFHIIEAMWFRLLWLKQERDMTKTIVMPHALSSNGQRNFYFDSLLVQPTI